MILYCAGICVFGYACDFHIHRKSPRTSQQCSVVSYFPVIVAASPKNVSLALQDEGYLIARSRNRLGMSESRLLSQ